MQIQLTWVRSEFPRGVKPLAKGTNTLVFADPDPTKVIVFLMCSAKFYWWKDCGLVTNPDDVHWFKDVEVYGKVGDHAPTLHGYTLYRVQAKKLFKPANGSPQKKEIVRVVREMEKLWNEARAAFPYDFRANYRSQQRRWSSVFWSRVNGVENLPEGVQDMARHCMNYDVVPDLIARNALVDADGGIAWSDLFIEEDIAEFVHMRKP